MVPGAGLEPARGYPQGIFLPATAFAAAPVVYLAVTRVAFGVWTLPSPCRRPGVRRCRRGPSSLYTFPDVASTA
jgi:hypothetical protein